MSRIGTALLGFLLTISLSGSSAFAVDGVREINQACRSAGCWLIDEPGSYRLTSDLVVTTSTNVLFVTADHVTIDLNGFQIIGTTTCTGTPPDEALVCSPTAGEASGVRAANSTNLTVRNGTVRGMGNLGVLCDEGCVVEKVRLFENGQGGARVDNGSIVRDCVAHRNGGDGLGSLGLGGMLFQNNVVFRNGGHGMSVTGHSTVLGNTAFQNRGTGIFTNPRSTIIGNTSNQNHVHGIRAFDSLALDNTADGNDGTGIEGSGGTAYGRNRINANGATVTATADELGSNSCNNGTTCP